MPAFKGILTLFITSRFDAIITFGGSPTGVIAPPILEKTTMEVNIGTGFISITSHNRMVTGVIKSTVVTLSKTAEINVAKKHSVVISGHNFPPVI